MGLVFLVAVMGQFGKAEIRFTFLGFVAFSGPDMIGYAEIDEPYSADCR